MDEHKDLHPQISPTNVHPATSTMFMRLLRFDDRAEKTKTSQWRLEGHGKSYIPCDCYFVATVSLAARAVQFFMRQATI